MANTWLVDVYKLINYKDIIYHIIYIIINRKIFLEQKIVII